MLKKTKKSNHKHKYDKEVLLRREVSRHIKWYAYHHAYYCSICGKFGNIKFMETKHENNRCTALTQEEILEKYKHLDIVDWDIKDKYVGKTKEEI